jgi:HEAT repeat protein
MNPMAFLRVRTLQRARDLPALLQLCEEGTPDERRYAARALGQLSATRAVPALVEILRGSSPADDWRTQAVAADALGCIGDGSAIASLSAVLADTRTNEDVRRRAALALGRIGAPRAAPALVAALGDRNVRDEAAAALAHLPLAGLADEDPETYRRAVEGLRELLYDQGEEEAEQEEALTALARIGATEQVAMARSHPSHLVRERAAELLERE